MYSTNNKITPPSHSTLLIDNQSNWNKQIKPIEERHQHRPAMEGLLNQPSTHKYLPNQSTNSIKALIDPTNAEATARPVSCMIK